MKRIIGLTLVFVMLTLLFPSLTTFAAISGDFEYTLSSRYAYMNGNASITNYIADAEHVIIPDTIDGYTVTGILSLRNLGFTSITLPDNLWIIGDGAFSNCSELTSINIPNSVTSIVANAFKGCSSLTSIVIPAGIKNLRYETFKDCTSLTTVVFKNPDTQIIEEEYSEYVYIHPMDGQSFTANRLPTFYNCPTLTDIYGFYGSTTETFAKNQGKTFIPIAKVELNGAELDFDVPPQLINGRTLVPMRAIFEALGMEVTWFDKWVNEIDFEIGWEEWDDNSRGSFIMQLMVLSLMAYKDDVFIPSDWSMDVPMIIASDMLFDTVILKSIILQIDNPHMIILNQSNPDSTPLDVITLDVSPQIVNSRTLVPIRAISEGFGAVVEWNEETQTVIITN